MVPFFLATKFSPLKPPGGYEKRQKGGLIFRGLGGWTPIHDNDEVTDEDIQDNQANSFTVHYISIFYNFIIKVTLRLLGSY